MPTAPSLDAEPNAGYTGSDDKDPICVVGMACRLPGGIASPSDLWEFLIDKRSAHGSVPTTRFNANGFYSADGGRSGVMDAPGGYFLDEDVRLFENSFFGINNLEATLMDPQQRKLLEVVFECFEHAGAPLETVSGTRTGVFVGNFTIDHLVGQTRDPDDIYRYTATGCGTTILANRISHVFNLHGPSYTLDTACSSSLYCLHNAVNAIKSGDCDAALVASVNLITAPEQMLGTAKAGVLSPTAACHTFDQSADGYGRAEGVSAILLKRQSDAIRDKDKIWAVVRGTAVNSNGKTPGITQPSTNLQEVVIRKAYSDAKLDFGETDYIEAHGTGTPVGDPIEVDAISRCFSKSRKANPLMIGSSKPGLGHSEAASGLTALIKVALALDKGIIPPTYGVTSLNPKLSLEKRHMQVVTEPKAWPRPLRRASVNAFGYGGANAHCILEAAHISTHIEERPILKNGLQDKSNGVVNGVNGINGTQVANGTTQSHGLNGVNGVNGVNGINGTQVVNGTTQRNGLNGVNGVNGRESLNGPQKAPEQLFVLPVSASSSKSLQTRVEQVREVIPLGDTSKLMSLTYMLAERRSHLSARQVIFARAAKDVHGYPKLAPEIEADGPHSATSMQPFPVGFVLTGQGAQYATMGKELLDTNDCFLATIRRLDGVLHALSSELAPAWTLEQTIRDAPEVSLIHEVTRSQPICTAIQVALIDVLGSWGIRPSAAVGHSSGEIAAAYAAGLITSSQAIRVAYFRGHAVGQLLSQGAMLAVGLPEQEAHELIKRLTLEEDVCVACINAPKSVTLSGTVRGIDQVMADLQRGGGNIFARKLLTGGRAYHSQMMREVGALYENLLKHSFHDGSSPSTTSTPRAATTMYSSVKFDGGQLAELDHNTDWPSYWRNNLEWPVQFQGALEALLRDNERIHLIEIGPHFALKGPIEQIRAYAGRDKQRVPYSPTLARGENAQVRMKKLAGSLFLYGHVLNWGSVNSLPDAARCLGGGGQPALPPYHWDYSAGLLWREPRISAEIRARTHPRHELLGSRQPAGNGITTTWRNNNLRLDEVPWLRHHKLETQIVFPAAGYLAMVIEAVAQIRPSVCQVTFRNVSLIAALVVPDGEQAGDPDAVEVHTSLTPKQLSTVTLSDEWHDFSISSWVAGRTTLHCAGSVRYVSKDQTDKTHQDNHQLDSVTVQNGFGQEFDEWSSMQRWYDKFEDGGLFFGPSFQSVQNLQTHSDRARHEVICTTRLNDVAAAEGSVHYPVHPVLIDACLQAGIMSATAGNVTTLRPFLPVFIDECRVRLSSKIIIPSNDEWQGSIHARATKTGVTTQRIDCTLRSPQGDPILHLNQVRMSQYTAKIAPEGSAKRERQPCLRVVWKPDLIRTLTPRNAFPLAKYVTRFVRKHVDAGTPLGDDERAATVACLLDLLGHQNPLMRVLELGVSCDCKSRLWKSLLGEGSGAKRYGSWHRGEMDECGVLDVHEEQPFDLVLMLPERSVSHDTDGFWEQGSQTLASSAVKPHAVVITRKTEQATYWLRQSLFTVVEVGSMLVARHKEAQDKARFLQNRRVIIVTHEKISTCPRISALTDALKEFLLQKDLGASEVKVIPLTQVPDIKARHEVIWISLVELEHTLLATMDQREMDLLRSITDEAKTLLWLTGANMLGAQPKPSLTLSSGLSRSLMLEQPSLHFTVMDIGEFLNDPKHNQATTCENILSALDSCLSDVDDREFIEQNGLLSIGRFSPDQDINMLFQRRFAAQDDDTSAIQPAPLESISPAELRIFGAGASDSIHFQQLRDPQDAPAPGFVDVLVKAVSLNAKDVYALTGRLETPQGHTACEYSGTVTAVGPDVTNVQVGDNVVALAPCRFATVTRGPAWAMHKMLPGEDANILPTLPVVYVSALYALRERAQLQHGESVLIHSGAGAFGMAAISLALRMGATVYTTVSSQAKRDAVATVLGLPREHIFHSRDSSFVDRVMAATQGHGVDVVVNSLVGDLMHRSWECIAHFGRFIEVGKRELTDAGRLDMSIFLRNATFSAFDLGDLFFSESPKHRRLFQTLTSEVLSLYRSGKIKPVPSTIFPVSETIKAYRHFWSKDRVGKIVINLENTRGRVPSTPAPNLTVFSPKKVYLLVGCLGGLGRSLSRWMVARGALNFIFLGRSGSDKPSAKKLISQLIAAGAKATVVRGNVSNVDDVIRAVSACRATGLAIGGVVQAAMGLSDGLFSRMTSQAWHQGIQPKWAGSMNLHAALQEHEADKELDFFLLMSSVSGSVGTATESNYCAANGFLDAFARWRRTLGRPAVSVGLGMISEVGYLHENPEIEALLLRRGIQPLNEAEFLQVMDLALSGTGAQCMGAHDELEEPWSAHILTGLEPFRVRQLREQGFDVTHGTMDDPRAAIISAAMAADHEERKDYREGKVNAAAASWLKNIPAKAAESLSSEGDAASLQVAVLRLVRKRFSNLILIPLEQIDNDKPLANFGVDSMIASEFRSWFWSAFKVDVPFLDLLSPEKTMNTLATFVEKHLVDQV